MTTQYFPGANTGNGFVSRFSGIVPPWEAPHYTYILKGGPGVGKNTLMKKISCLARVNGLMTEEFRCAGAHPGEKAGDSGRHRPPYHRARNARH